MNYIRIIGGHFKGLKLPIPPSSITRPTMDRVRENVFNIISSNLEKWGFPSTPLHVMDGFSGSGSMGLEAYSRWGCNTLFIENNPHAKKILESNIAYIQKKDSSALQKLTLKSFDMLDLPLNTGHPMDVIFMDPPYDFSTHDILFNNLAQNKWTCAKTILILESDKTKPLTLSAHFQQLDAREYGRVRITIFQP